MQLFNSSLEKRLWLCALVVLVTIFSTLAFGRPLQDALRDQNTQAVFFLTGMVLTAATILIYGIRVRPSATEWVIWLGLAAVYVMFFFRLGAPERSHLIEYSVLAVFIHMAITERRRGKNQILLPALMAFGITAAFGVCDEVVQRFVPNRIFDPVDIQFNTLAALTAVGASAILQWARKRLRKSR